MLLSSIFSVSFIHLMALFYHFLSLFAMGDRILIVPVSRIRLFAPFLRFGNREIHTEFPGFPISV